MKNQRNIDNSHTHAASTLNSFFSSQADFIYLVPLVAICLFHAMNTYINDIFDNVSRCTKSLAEISNAVSAAHKSAAAIPFLHRESQPLLVGARLLRTESLFHVMSEPLQSFDIALQLIQKQASAIVSLPVVQIAAWNTLSDQWYIDHATRLLDILSNVINAREDLTVALKQPVRSEFNSHPSYTDLVENVHHGFRNLETAWYNCLRFIDGWRDIATSVIGGIGESGSLLPQQ